MKLGPVTKLDKRNKASEKFDVEVMSGNCDIIVISWFLANLEQFGGWILDTVCKNYVFTNSNQ